MKPDHSHNHRPAGKHALLLIGVLWLLCAHARADNGRLILAIPPVQSTTALHAVYQPLADYIGKTTGKTCVLLTHIDFFAYWNTIRQGQGYDLALDEAHFTDYRIQKLGFTVLVKMPAMVTYSLVVSGKKRSVHPGQLVGRRIATLGIPSGGAARLNALFPNPTRQPITIEAKSVEQAMQMLLDGKVVTAILPTPYVNQQIAKGADVRMVLLTEPIPHIALSAAPGVDAGTRDTLRKALLDADQNPDGRRMLQAMGIEKFDPATAAIYVGQSRVLAEYWGY